MANDSTSGEVTLAVLGAPKVGKSGEYIYLFREKKNNKILLTYTIVSIIKKRCLHSKVYIVEII